MEINFQNSMKFRTKLPLPSFSCFKKTEQITQIQNPITTNNQTLYWNSMIKTCSKNPNNQSQVLSLYIRMLQESLKPNNFILPIIVKSCLGLNELKSIQSQAVKFGFENDCFVCKSLLLMYVNFRCIDTARQLFDEMPERDVVSWNIMIGGYTESDQPGEAFFLSRRLGDENVRASEVTMVVLLCACGKSGFLNGGKLVHGLLEKKGLGFDMRVNNAVIDMYGKCRDLKSARHIFDEMSEKNLISWTSLVHGYGLNGFVGGARELFDEMPERNVVAWSCMINCYVSNGFYFKALEVFREMKDVGVRPNEATIASVLCACANLGALEEGKFVHSLVGKLGIKLSVVLGTSLVDMYCKCGSLEKAIEVFEEMSERNVVAWTTMIVGLAWHGQGKRALRLFSQMESLGLRPNGVTFVGVLGACSHAGLVEEGYRFFNLMRFRYLISPELEHYGCMVDILGRAGRFQEAVDLIRSMPMEANSVVLGALLGACQAHRNLELGEQVGKHLLELEPHHCGRYIVLANIYAASKKWEEASNVRKMMEERGVQKKPGYSWVEMNGMVHKFSMGDKTHMQTAKIYAKLHVINQRLRGEGYVAQTDQVRLDIEEEEKENALAVHSEKLAIAFALISSGEESSILVVKNLRICADCHAMAKLVSKIYDKRIVVRDCKRFHHFEDGNCSCMDYW